MESGVGERRTGGWGGEGSEVKRGDGECGVKNTRVSVYSTSLVNK